MERPRWKRVLGVVALWIPTALMGFLFTMQGLAKFPADSPWPEMFRGWGYPDGFHLAVGVLELVGGLGLFVPRISGYAASLLALVMLGALGTHLLHGEGVQTIGTSVFVGVLATLAWVRLRRSRPVATRQRVQPAG